jgi:branched-chain amino acid transport system permease protein
VSRPAIVVIVAFLAVAVAGAWTGIVSSFYVGLLTQALLTALFVMSLDLLVGYTGLDSLGHAAFFGFGGYVAALLSAHGVTNVFPLLLASAAGSGLLGMLFGAVALRASGAYFLIISMALGYLPWALAIRWRSFTGGSDGLPGLLRPDLGFGISLVSGPAYFTFVTLFVIACALVLAAIGGSSFGQALRGIKDSPSRMAALGYNVWLHKYVCFIIAAVFAGMAGMLAGFYTGLVSPDDLSVSQSAFGLRAVILGGAGTLLGPAIGAASIILIHFTLGALTPYWNSLLGCIYIAVVLFAPRGVFRRFVLARKANAA